MRSVNALRVKQQVDEGHREERFHFGQSPVVTDGAGQGRLHWHFSMIAAETLGRGRRLLRDAGLAGRGLEKIVSTIFSRERMFRTPGDAVNLKDRIVSTIGP